MTKRLFDEIRGSEVWVDLDRFGERVCLLIEFGICKANGIGFKPTKEEIKEIEEAYIVQEYGGRAQLNRDLEEEFGIKLNK